MAVEHSLIVQLRKANPCATLQEIASQMGVSRERVRQLLAAEGQPTKGIRLPKHACANCHKRLCKPTQTGYCEACRTELWTYVVLPCVQCGKPVRRQVSGIVNNARHGGQGHVFCDRVCSGRWRGLTSGFAAHPENMALGHPTSPATSEVLNLVVGSSLTLPCRWKHWRYGCRGYNWGYDIGRRTGHRFSGSCRGGMYTITRRS